MPTWRPTWPNIFWTKIASWFARARSKPWHSILQNSTAARPVSKRASRSSRTGNRNAHLSPDPHRARHGALWLGPDCGRWSVHVTGLTSGLVVAIGARLQDAARRAAATGAGRPGADFRQVWPAPIHQARPLARGRGPRTR